MGLVVALSDLVGRFVRKEKPETLAQSLARHVAIAKPEAPGPFPVVLQFHGCGGLVAPGGSRQPIMDEYAEALLAKGVAVVTVESYPHRGIGRTQALTKVCSGSMFRGAERAGDVLAALDHVRRLPWVDRRRIGLAGWSHGGWSIMDLLAMDLDRERPHNLKSVPAHRLEGVAAVHLTYPWCGAIIALTPNRGWRIQPRTRIVIAEHDSIAPRSGTDQAIARMRNSGVPVDVRVFDGLDHAFDERFQEPGSPLKFVEHAAQTAREEYAEWFAKALSPQPPAMAASPTPAQ